MFDRIQLLMMSRHMNKVELAKEIGVSSSNMSDWANGKIKPSLDKMIRIADYFNVSLDYLVGRDDRFPALDPDAWDMVKVYNDLDKEGQTIVRGVAYQQKQRMAAQGK